VQGVRQPKSTSGVDGAAQEVYESRAGNGDNLHPFGDASVFIPHGRRDTDLGVETVEQIQPTDPLQVNQAGRVRETNGH
jgi:hypothetical protein